MSQPCLNHGVCVDQPDGYFCRCLPGYVGDHCEIESRQAKCDDDCPPFADCNPLDGGCICKPDFPGVYPNCSREILCRPGMCKNGGVCDPLTGNCSCSPGFIGELNINHSVGDVN